jgi:hypothetical protein
MSVTTTRQSMPVTQVLQPQNFEQLVTFANMAAKTSMVPTAFRGKPEDIMITVQFGSELGLSPMQSLQSVACINGKPALWGDAVIGLCQQSPLCEDIIETMEGEGDARKAVCVAKRFGKTAVKVEFSISDAKKAGLWGKQGPWTQYAERMLKMRARGFALRDAFPDLLKGLKTVEELNDYPTKPDLYAGTTIDAKAEPTHRAAPATDIPSLDDDDPMRTRVDRLIVTLAACSSEMRVVAYEAKAKALLADIDAADRDDLKEMAVSALAAARARFEPSTETTYADEWAPA